MAYTTIDFQTKKALKDAIANGKSVSVYQPGPFGDTVADGLVALEGPHSPRPHKWYARGIVQGGRLVKVT